MGIVISFEDYRPPPRWDAEPWTAVRVQEAIASDGPWVQIDEIALSPTDADPTTPQNRSFTTDGTAVGLWYRVLFVDADSDTSSVTAAIRNAAGTSTVYTTVAELTRILKLRTPTVDQTAAMNRVIAAAAGEINAEIDLAADDELADWELDLCAQVNLDRAADLWRHTESVPGLVGIPDEAMPTTFGRYSWERYAQRLAPIKQQWGLA
jgi:hypothetical protein